MFRTLMICRMPKTEIRGKPNVLGIMKKVMITGASGLLGRALVSAFSTDSWEVLGLAFSRAKDKLIKVDLNNKNEVEKIIHDFKPDVIIHCAAQRSPDKVEKEYEATRALNVACSKTLAEFASSENAAFIYISTDYVFDGTNPPYSEADKPNPVNKYGLTKLEGENEVLNIYPGACILRIPVIYGDESYLGESAISCLIKNVLCEEPIKVSHYEIRFPSHTYDISRICVQLSDKKLKDPSLNSIFHWCGLEHFTKYEMTKIIAEEFSCSYSHVLPDDNPSSGVSRPKNTQLSCRRLQDLGIAYHTPFRNGIKSSFKKFFEKIVD